MSKKNKSPFQLDSYRSRSARVDFLNKPDNIYAKAWFSNLAVAAFVIIDLFCLKVVWNLVQTEDPFFVWCLAAACAIALDVPLAIAAVAQKKYEQGMYSKQGRNQIVILSLLVVAIAVIFSFGFKVYTRDLSFSIGAAETAMDMMETGETAGDDYSSAILFAALFNGIIPFLTSVSSYVISYFSYDPLGMILTKLEKEKTELQANILEAEKALAEVESSEEFCKALMARENDLFSAFIEQLNAEAMTLKEQKNLILMKEQEKSEDIVVIAESGVELMKNYHGEDTPWKELPEVLNGQIQKEKSEITRLADHAA